MRTPTPLCGTLEDANPCPQMSLRVAGWPLVWSSSWSCSHEVHLTPADRLQHAGGGVCRTIGASGDTTLNLSEGAQGTLGSESTSPSGRSVQPCQLLLSNVARTRSSPRRRWNSPAMRRMAMPAPPRNGSGRRPSSRPSPVPTPLGRALDKLTGNIIDMECSSSACPRHEGSFQRWADATISAGVR